MHLILVILLITNGLVFAREYESTSPLAGNKNKTIPICTTDDCPDDASLEKTKDLSNLSSYADSENVTLSKTVYIVLRRSLMGKWRPMIRTTAFQTNVSEYSSSVVYRVIIVDPIGLPRVYGSSESEDIGKSLISGLRSSLYNRTYLERSTKETTEWTITVERVVRQKVLVLIKIRWKPRALLGLYLVTWEVDGGGIKGNLFTTSNHVTLSLWPNTIYHIQSELISSNISIENDKSNVISIDTDDVSASSDNANNIMDETDDEDDFYAVLVEPFRENDFSLEERSALYLILACIVIIILSLIIKFALKRCRKTKKDINLNDHIRVPYKTVIFTVDKV